MEWGHFHFNCRFLARKIEQNQSKESALADLASIELTSVFGNDSAKGLPSKLFAQIKSINCPKLLKSSLEHFSALDLSSTAFSRLNQDETFQSLHYLLSVFAIYLMVSTLYILKIHPGYETLFSIYGHGLPTHTAMYFSAYQLLTSIVLIIMLFCILMQKKFKKLESDIVLGHYSHSFLFPKKLSEQSTEISKLIRLPFLLDKGTDAEFNEQIQNAKKLGFEPQLDIAPVIEEKSRMIGQMTNNYLRRITKIANTILYIFIGWFIIAMYLPIFQLGELI